MEVYKSIKRSVSATANGIIGSSIFSNTTSASGNSGTHSWIHPPDTLINGRVEYAVKMLGKKDVQEAKGTHIVREAIHTIRFHLQVKRGETGHSGAKLQKVLLQISIYGVNVMDLKTRVILYKHPLNRISFCADDKMDKRVFSYIAKADDGKHQCFVFLSDKMAENITLTIGEAFDLAYEKFIKKKGKDLENQKQMLLLKKRIAELEEKNKLLETKLERCCCPEGRKISNLLIPKAPVPSKPPDIISTSILNGATSPPPPPLPILPPPRRTSSQNNSNILAEIFERNDNFNHGTQPVNFGELYDDSFDPRADEKKETATSSTETDAGQRNTVAEFEALLRRVDLQLAEVQNGLSTWKFERGDTGDAGRDWPTESDEQKEEEPQLSCPPSSTSNAKG